MNEPSIQLAAGGIRDRKPQQQASRRNRPRFRRLGNRSEAHPGQEIPADRCRGPRPKGLERFLHRWDSSTMTLTAYSKGRIACRDLFPPHASFEALKEPDGRVTLIRLRREEKKPRLVKPIVRKGLLVLPMDNVELDSEALEIGRA